MTQLLPGTIVNRTYGTHQKKLCSPIFTSNSWSYLTWFPAIGIQRLFIRTCNMSNAAVMGVATLLASLVTLAAIIHVSAKNAYYCTRTRISAHAFIRVLDQSRLPRRKRAACYRDSSIFSRFFCMYHGMAYGPVVEPGFVFVRCWSCVVCFFALRRTKKKRPAAL